MRGKGGNQPIVGRAAAGDSRAAAVAFDPAAAVHPERSRGDGLGSTRQLSDSSQAVTDSRDYRAFGQPTVLSGADPNRFGWVGRAGYYRQPDLGNYWLRARVYEDDNARFLSRDPAMADVNGYRYANNNPVTLTDPAGLQACHTPSDPCWRHRRAGAGLGAAAMGGPGGGMGGGPPRMRVACPGMENRCCEVPRPGLGWWSMPQGRPHENWEEASCSCGESPPNCTVTLHKRLLAPGDKWAEQKMVRRGRCVPCGAGVVPGMPEYPGAPGVEPTGGQTKICGPDITGALAQTLCNMRNAFWSVSAAQRARFCLAFVPPWTVNAADILDLLGGAPSYPGCGTPPDCEWTVQVDGQCHNAWVVNYVQMGVGYSLCETRIPDWARLLPQQVYPYCMAMHRDHRQCLCALAWFAAGYAGWPAAATPQDCRPDCAYCHGKTTGAFTVRWDGAYILPNGAVI